jgi:hypothetical protein
LIGGAKADELYLGNGSAGARCDGKRRVTIGEDAGGCVRIRGYIAAGADRGTDAATSGQQTLFGSPRVNKMRVGAAGTQTSATPGFFFLHVGTSETAR